MEAFCDAHSKSPLTGFIARASYRRWSGDRRRRRHRFGRRHRSGLRHRSWLRHRSGKRFRRRGRRSGWRRRPGRGHRIVPPNPARRMRQGGPPHFLVHERLLASGRAHRCDPIASPLRDSRVAAALPRGLEHVGVWAFVLPAPSGCVVDGKHRSARWIFADPAGAMHWVEARFSRRHATSKDVLAVLRAHGPALHGMSIRGSVRVPDTRGRRDRNTP